MSRNDQIMRHVWNLAIISVFSFLFFFFIYPRFAAAAQTSRWPETREYPRLGKVIARRGVYVRFRTVTCRRKPRDDAKRPTDRPPSRRKRIPFGRYTGEPTSCPCGGCARVVGRRRPWPIGRSLFFGLSAQQPAYT